MLPAGLPSSACWITPGYLLGDIVTWRMRLDWIERLALALPLGVVILAIPGTMALLLHLTLTQLALGWMITSALVVVAWLIWGVRVPEDELPQRWGWDEIVLFLIIAVAFIAVVPTLNLYKIDGDAYVVNSFSADALAGLPLNETEPLFGTDLALACAWFLTKPCRSSICGRTFPTSIPTL